MADTLTWLHLSDFHLCQPENDWHAREIIEKLQADIGKLVDQHGLKPDLLFVTGDLAYGQLGEGPKSLPDQFQETQCVIDAIRERLVLPVERVFPVPGNHDIDRDQVLEPQTLALAGMDEAAVSEM